MSVGLYQTVYCEVRNRKWISVLYRYMRNGLVTELVRMKVMFHESWNCGKSSFWRSKCDVYTKERMWGWKLLRIQYLVSICNQSLYVLNSVEGMLSCFKFAFVTSDDTSCLIQPKSLQCAYVCHCLCNVFLAGDCYGVLNWLGHVELMTEDNVVQKIKRWRPMTKRPIWRTNTRWEYGVFGDIRSMNVNNWKKVAQDRDSWKTVVERARILHRV
jgi:hypothetical protein